MVLRIGPNTAGMLWCARATTSWLHSRTGFMEQDATTRQLREAVVALTARTRCPGLTPCEAIGQAMLDSRPGVTRTPDLEFRMWAGSM